jgi:hypothetical protein
MPSDASAPAAPPSGQLLTKTWARPLLVAGLVVALLVVHWSLGVLAWRNKCQTYDETPHITAGYSYWKFGDFRLHPENGNLPQRWVSFPLLFMPDVRFPSQELPAWERSDMWEVGEEFCHRLGNDWTRMLGQSRSWAALLGVAVCLTVFIWSRRLFGTVGGLVSLLLCALCPTMLAHAPLATSDMCATLFFTLSVACVWSALQHVTVLRVLISALVVAALFLSKVSAVLIVPMTALMVAAHWFLHRKLTVTWRGQTWEVTSRSGWAAVLTGIVAIHVVVSIVLIWWAYGWRHSPAPADAVPPRYFKYETMEEAARRAGTAGGLLYWMSEQRFLPEAYLYGAAFTLSHRKRASFLNGEHSLRGWPHYFIYCVLVKTPLALFGLLLAAAAWGIRQYRQKATTPSSVVSSHPLLVSLVPLFTLLLVYWCAAIASSINIGHRHMLPTHPAMFILAGASARWFSRETRLAACVVIALLVAFALESARAYPHYLAYFNPLVRRETAYRHLVDSNLDWGQDLPGLKQWLVQHAGEVAAKPVYLAYFGTGSPDYYAVQAQRLPVMADIDSTPQLRAGIYCLSATALANVQGEAPGRWNQRYEEVYRGALEALKQAELQPNATPSEDERAFNKFVLWLRLARLYAYLRPRDPDDHVGYSILIYDVSDEQIEAALLGPPVELDRQSWAEREETSR